MKKRIWKWSAIVLVALMLGLCAAGYYYFEHTLPRLLVCPKRQTFTGIQPAETPAKYGLKFTPYDVATRDGLKLACWFIPAVDAPAKGTVVILHGFSGSKEQMRDQYRLIAVHGWNAVVYDSRAHGESGGEFCSYGHKEKEDVGGVISQTREQFGDLGPVAVLGVSYGGAVALQALAVNPDIHCGISISSFCRLEDVARVHFRAVAPFEEDWIFHRILSNGERLAGFRVQDVQPIAAAKQIHQPVLVIHGTNDELCPISEARHLFENIPAAQKQWYEANGSDHAGVLQYGDVVNIHGRIVRFLHNQVAVQ